MLYLWMPDCEEGVVSVIEEVAGKCQITRMPFVASNLCDRPAHSRGVRLLSGGGVRMEFRLRGLPLPARSSAIDSRCPHA